MKPTPSTTENETRRREAPVEVVLPTEDPTALPIIDFAASTARVDRYRESLDPAGWVLDNYRTNPVFQNCHQYKTVTDTLGTALLTEVRDGMLWQRILFATLANPLAQVAYKLYRGKFLRAVSVGFKPLAWTDFSSEESATNGGCQRKYTRQELLEVSAVSIPANPDALALAIRSGAVGRSDLDDLHDLITTLRNHSPTSPAASAADGRSSDAWMRCLETAHRIMCR